MSVEPFAQIGKKANLEHIFSNPVLKSGHHIKSIVEGIFLTTNPFSIFIFLIKKLEKFENMIFPKKRGKTGNKNEIALNGPR